MIAESIFLCSRVTIHDDATHFLVGAILNFTSEQTGESS